MTGMLDGKVALVTGGSSGIGKRTAIKFAEEGANVVVADVREAEGEETVRLIEKAGGEGLFVKADVSEERDAWAMVEAAVETFGRLDCAFNNAGKLTGHKGGWTETPAEFYDDLIDTNLRGVWLCMKYELRQMLRQGSGAIVNNSSIGGIRGGRRDLHCEQARRGGADAQRGSHLWPRRNQGQRHRSGHHRHRDFPGKPGRPTRDGAQDRLPYTTWQGRYDR